MAIGFSTSPSADSPQFGVNPSFVTETSTLQLPFQNRDLPPWRLIGAAFIPVGQGQYASHGFQDPTLHLRPLARSRSRTLPSSNASSFRTMNMPSAGRVRWESDRLT